MTQIPGGCAIDCSRDRGAEFGNHRPSERWISDDHCKSVMYCGGVKKGRAKVLPFNAPVPQLCPVGLVVALVQASTAQGSLILGSYYAQPPEIPKCNSQKKCLPIEMGRHHKTTDNS